MDKTGKLSSLHKSSKYEDFRYCMVSNESIDKYELTCCIKVPVNKNGITETRSKTQYEWYIPKHEVTLNMNDIFQTALSLYE